MRFGIGHTQRRPKRHHFLGHNRIEQRRTDAQTFRRRIKAVRHLRLCPFLLGQTPRRTLLQININFADHRHHCRHRRIQLHIADHSAHFIRHRHGFFPQRILKHGVDSVGACPRHFSAAVTRDHVQHAVGHVAEVVSEIRIIAFHKRLFCEGGILPQRHFSDQKIAEGIDAVTVDHIHWIHHIPQRLAHLRAPGQPPAVCKNALRHFNAHRLEHRRPIDRVRSENILPDEMARTGPPLFEAFLIGFIANG